MGIHVFMSFPKPGMITHTFLLLLLLQAQGKITMHKQYLTVIKTWPLKLAMDQAVDLSLTTLSNILLKAQFPQL